MPKMLSDEIRRVPICKTLKMVKPFLYNDSGISKKSRYLLMFEDTRHVHSTFLRVSPTSKPSSLTIRHLNFTRV